MEVNIEVLTYAPAWSASSDQDTIIKDEQLVHKITEFENWDNEEYYTKALSVIQSVIQIKTKIDRSYVKKDNSKGAVIKKLEETIANLDNKQEVAIIEYHDGLQRIRGLAGSGKTIVLALKAAYLHALHPEWTIAITFNTRALKNQFYELIELFCIQKMGRKPDQDKIRIFHAWGGPHNTGLYFEFCKYTGVDYLDFRQGKYYSTQTGQTSKPLFEVLCAKAINEVKGKQIEPIYDVILVDEAQDLSGSFLNLCYLLLKGPKKRLIYAYDELQKLNEGTSLPNPKNIFNNDDEFSDIILKKCYRNSKPVLVTAHALGLGIYRKSGFAQFFDQPQLWKDVGYNIKGGAELKAGQNVRLYRDDEATHKLLEQISDPEDIIKFESFKNKEEQAKQLLKEIKKNLAEDELQYKDIVVINPIATTTKDEVSTIRALLEDNGIKTHIAGDSNPDVFFEKDSVTFSGINRAKGNEVPMVYIINANDCFSHPILENLDLTRRRNILFTAITRSKAWVRVYGIGKKMDDLIEEFNQVKQRDFELEFKYPTQEEIDKMNIISRDISSAEEGIFKDEIEDLWGITKIIERISKKEAYIEDYPEPLRDIIKKILGNK